MNFLVWLLLIFAGAFSAEVPVEISRAFSQETPLELFSIFSEKKPESKKPTLLSYPIRKQQDVKGATAQNVKAAILGAIAEYRGEGARCFIPHHAVRWKEGDKEKTLLICFKCFQGRLFEGEQTIAKFTIGRSAQPLLDAVIGWRRR